MRQPKPNETTTIAQFGGPLDHEHAEPLVPDDGDGVLLGVEEILSHYRSDAFVLEAYGHLAEARLIHEICSDIAHALTDFLVFIDEEKAMRSRGGRALRSESTFRCGRSRGMRGRRRGWAITIARSCLV